MSDGSTGTNSTAIVHDQFVARGGAEHVALHMARTLDCPIYAGRVDASIVPPDVDVIEVFDSRLGQRCMDSHYLVQDVYQMLAWQRAAELRQFDRLIVNKTNPLWYVPQEQQTVVAYLHSTPRGQYDQFARRDHTLVDVLIKTGMRTLFDANRLEPDHWMCNSELVQQRLRKYWRVPETESTVVYPPVETGRYSPDLEATDDYYLSVSRLRDHKRVDQIIRAFNALGPAFPLKIAGAGPEREQLERMADDHIEFCGYVDDDEKRRLYSGAKAFVMAAENEDFGMTPIEAMASGTPVLGIREGFTTHQIVEGKTGYTWPRVPGRLAACVRRYDREGVDWDAAEIADFAAQQYDAEQFETGLVDTLEQADERATIDPYAPAPRPDVVAADGGEEE